MGKDFRRRRFGQAARAGVTQSAPVLLGVQSPPRSTFRAAIDALGDSFLKTVK
jgi:hypothetical protein